MADQEVGIVLTAKDMASSTIKKVKGEVAGLNDAASIANSKRPGGGVLGGIHKEFGGFRQAGRQALTDVNKGIHQTGANLQRLAMVGGAAVIGLGAAAVKAAGDWESGQNTINTIMREGNDALKQRGEDIRETARRTGQDQNDLQMAYYDILSAGITNQAAAKKMLNDATTIGIGALGSTADGVDLLTTAANSYKLNAKQTTDAANMFAKAVEVGKIKLTDISSTFANVAPNAAAYKIGINEIAASYGFLTAKGLQAGQVTTQMDRAITELAKPGTTLKKLMSMEKTDYSKLAGDIGLVPALEQLRKDAAKHGIKPIDLFGRKEGYNYFLETTGRNFADWQKNQKETNRASADDTMNKQAQERMKGLNFEIQRLKTNVKDAGITIGTALMPKIADLAKKGADWLQANPQKVEKFATDIARGFDQIFKFVSQIPWENVAAFLKQGAGFAATLMKAFAGAPPWLQTAVATGWGLNKISGGMLTDLMGTGLKGLIGGTAGILGNRGSSPSSPMYVRDVAGGLGGAGEGTPGASGGRGWMGGMKGMIAGGIAIGIGQTLKSGALGGGGIAKAAGSLTTIAGAFMMGGPVLGALAAVEEAITTVADVWGSIGNGQKELAAKNATIKDNDFGNLIQSARQTSSYLANIQGLDRMLLDTTASKETGAGLIEIARGLLQKSDTREQKDGAVAAIKSMQKQAKEHGWTEVEKTLSTIAATLEHKGIKVKTLPVPKHVAGRGVDFGAMGSGASGGKTIIGWASKFQNKHGNVMDEIWGGTVKATVNASDTVKHRVYAAMSQITAAAGKDGIATKREVHRAMKNIAAANGGAVAGTYNIHGTPSAAQRKAATDAAKTATATAQTKTETTHVKDTIRTTAATGQRQAAAQASLQRAQGNMMLFQLRGILNKSQDVIVNVHPQPISLAVSGRSIASAITTETTSRSPMYQGA